MKEKEKRKRGGGRGGGSSPTGAGSRDRFVYVLLPGDKECCTRVAIPHAGLRPARRHGNTAYDDSHNECEDGEGGGAGGDAIDPVMNGEASPEMQQDRQKAPIYLAYLRDGFAVFERRDSGVFERSGSRKPCSQKVLANGKKTGRSSPPLASCI